MNTQTLDLTSILNPILDAGQIPAAIILTIVAVITVVHIMRWATTPRVGLNRNPVLMGRAITLRHSVLAETKLRLAANDQ